MPDAGAFMYRFRISARLSLCPKLVLNILLLLTLIVQAYGSTTKRSREEIPVELQASDPEVKQLLDAAADNFDVGDLEVTGQLLGKAQELCRSRRLTSDVPIVQIGLASLSISSGNIDNARDLFTQALQFAAERSNMVLEAQILVSLAALKEMAGDRTGALETDRKALAKAESGKSLYVQSRALGEIGRILLGAGAIGEAQTSINKALDIDKANRYSLEALHRVYLVYSHVAKSDQNLPNARFLLKYPSVSP
jgi:tetratricopeptide (TPR) repeat protein